MHRSIWMPLAFVCLGTGAYAQGPTINGCPAFPANSIYNTRIDSLPVHARSSAWISTINSVGGGPNHMHVLFGTQADNGMPINYVAGNSAARKTITFDDTYSSDPGPYPIPASPLIQEADIASGSDHHMLIVDTDNCLAYEIFNIYSNVTGNGAQANPDGSWHATQGNIFNLKSNLLRPDPMSSADAAGMAMIPTLVRYDEAASGSIKHAMRVTAGAIGDMLTGHVWPATHDAGGCSDPNQCPPFGARLRLRPDWQLPASANTPVNQAIVTAMKQYGFFLTDNGGSGGSWFVSGVPDSRWDDTTLHYLFSAIIPSTDLQFVDDTTLGADSRSQAVNTNPDKFQKPQSGGGWYEIMNVATYKCVSLTGRTNLSIGTGLELDACDGRPDQRVFLYPNTTDGTWFNYFITPYSTLSQNNGYGYLISAPNGADGSQLQLQNNGATRTGGQYHWIASNTILNYASISPFWSYGQSWTVNGAGIDQHNYNHTDNTQNWVLVPTHN